MVDVPRDRLLDARIRRIVRETLEAGQVKSFPQVAGQCPACGKATLFMGEGGYLTCSLIDCPMPDAASRLLLDHTELEHTFIVHVSLRRGDRSFTIRHPLMDRLTGVLEECSLHTYLSLRAQELAAGRYRATQGDGGSWVTWEMPDVSGS
jgi:hypothetical protein